MKPSSNVCGTTTKVPSKREDKKGINIRWNSGIFFQVGLIVSLLAMFFVMELEIGVGNKDVVAVKDRIWETVPNITYVIEEPKVVLKEKPKTQVRKKVKVTQPITQTFVSVPNEAPVIEGKVIAQDHPTDPVITSVIDTPKIPETQNMMKVEFAPIFPGCEGVAGKTASVECLSSKIRAFIGRKFDTEKFNYFEPGSVQNIRTMFTIDKNGNITDIKVRAKDKKLETEARKVLTQLPRMIPGKQGATNVNVSYAVPISFKVEH